MRRLYHDNSSSFVNIKWLAYSSTEHISMASIICCSHIGTRSAKADIQETEVEFVHPISVGGVNFSIFTHFLCFFLLKLLKLGEIDGVKFLAWKSDGAKFLTNSMSDPFPWPLVSTFGLTLVLITLCSNLLPWFLVSASGLVVLSRKEAGNPRDYFDKSFLEYKKGFSARGQLELNHLHRVRKQTI